MAFELIGQLLNVTLADWLMYAYMPVNIHIEPDLHLDAGLWRRSVSQEALSLCLSPLSPTEMLMRGETHNEGQTRPFSRKSSLLTLAFL